MARIRCFLLEATDRVSVKLRRYHPSASEADRNCPVNKGGYHNAATRIENEPAEHDDPRNPGYITNGMKPATTHDDPRWPTHCACGYEFRENDEWQRFVELIYRRADTGEELALRDAPPGAMWEAPWLDGMYTPQGDHNLVVMTPGGEWTIDGQASNCTIPDDQKQEKHHCWVRSGIAPDITVGKDGPTCSAGAGSIQCRSYHGFLRNGWLEE